MKVSGYRIHRWGDEPRWETFEIDPPGPGEVLVKVEACGIGLTVLNCIRGDLGNDPALLPRVPGHELIGRVEKLGQETSTLEIGQRVMAYFYLICGACRFCRNGRDSLCTHLQGWIGVHRDGGYASHAVLPEKSLLPLRASLSSEEATAIPDAIATSLHVCRTRARIQPLDRVIVIGAGGGVGLHVLQMARLFGADVVGLDVAGHKSDAIREAGARPVIIESFTDLDPMKIWEGKRGTDVLVDLVGRAESLEWGLQTLAVGGRMIVLTTFRHVNFPVDPRQLVLSELNLAGSRYASKGELLEAAQLVESGRIRPVVSRIVSPEKVLEVHDDLKNGTLVGRAALSWGI